VAEPIAIQGDPIAIRGDPIAIHGEPIAIQGDRTAIQGDLIAKRADPIAIRADAVANRGDAIAIRRHGIARAAHPIASGRASIASEVVLVPPGRVGWRAPAWPLYFPSLPGSASCSVTPRSSAKDARPAEIAGRVVLCGHLLRAGIGRVIY
jgi:uncharacterized Zn-binding protein involved in type VI secretion